MVKRLSKSSMVMGEEVEDLADAKAGVVMLSKINQVAMIGTEEVKVVDAATERTEISMNNNKKDSKKILIKTIKLKIKTPINQIKNLMIKKPNRMIRSKQMTRMN